MKKQMRDVIVTCAEDDGCVSRVAGSLRKMGFQVESVLELAGNVVGKWDDELDPLRKLPGVTAVEESEEKFTQ